MKHCTLGPDCLAYRFLKPRSAVDPLCGKDVAEAGGRFTRPGVEALYLGMDPETALAEYAQGDSRLEPAILVTYVLHLPRIADLGSGDTGGWPDGWQHWRTDWRAARDRGETPASWPLGDQLAARGLCGLRFPSTRRAGGCNILILPRCLTGAERIHVHDSRSSLPRNRRSWDRAAGRAG